MQPVGDNFYNDSYYRLMHQSVRDLLSSQCSVIKRLLISQTSLDLQM